MSWMKRVQGFASLAARAVFREMIDAAVQFSSQPGKDHAGGKRQLVIVRLDAIGDFILFLDTFKEYRRLFPADEWEITLLGNRAWADLAEPLPYADRYWFVDCDKLYRGPVYRYRMLKALRKARFDTVIHPVFSRVYATGDAVVRTTGASVRIGSAGERLGNAGTAAYIHARQRGVSDRWYTRLVPVSDEPVTEIERNAEFLRVLGLGGFQASAPVYPLDRPPQHRHQSGCGIDGPYFVVAPGAGAKGREWSPQNFAAVSKWLYAHKGWTPVICGGPGEEAAAEGVISMARTLPWSNLAGRTTLRELARILGDARMLLANESAPAHLAAAVGCPVVCIMGGGHFGRFFPYGDPSRNRIVYKEMDCCGCNWICKYAAIRCIAEISVDQVLDVVRESIERIA